MSDIQMFCLQRYMKYIDLWNAIRHPIWRNILRNCLRYLESENKNISFVSSNGSRVDIVMEKIIHLTCVQTIFSTNSQWVTSITEICGAGVQRALNILLIALKEILYFKLIRSSLLNWLVSVVLYSFYFYKVCSTNSMVL